MQVLRHTAAVIATAAMYCLIYQINEFAFSDLRYAHGVMWIFLPSGLSLAAALVFGCWGALGIGSGAFVMCLFANPAGNMICATGLAVASGASCLLALWICQNKFKLDGEMTALSAPMLLKMAGIFAIVSPLFHQTWYLFRGRSDSMISNLLVMTTGDFFGTMILFYVAKLFLSQLPRGLLSK